MKLLCELIWRTSEYFRVPLGPIAPWVFGGMIGRRPRKVWKIRRKRISRSIHSPKQWPPEQLQRERRKLDSDDFHREYMNAPFDQENSNDLR